jgi:hypothetical protein
VYKYFDVSLFLEVISLKEMASFQSPCFTVSDEGKGKVLMWYFGILL